MGPRRLAERAWIRYRTRRGARFPMGHRNEQIELAYKTGFDAGLVKGVQRGREEVNEAWTRHDQQQRAEAETILPALEGRSQRHQDFILLVQTMVLSIVEPSRPAASIVAEAMELHPPADETEFAHDNPRQLDDYVREFVFFRLGEGKRPDWLMPGVFTS